MPKKPYDGWWWAQGFCGLVFAVLGIGAIIVAALHGVGNEIGLTNESDFAFTATTWLVVWGSVITAAVILWCIGFWYGTWRWRHTKNDAGFMFCIWLVWGLLAFFVLVWGIIFGSIMFIRAWNQDNDLEYGWSIAALALTYLLAAFLVYRSAYMIRKNSDAGAAALGAAERAEQLPKAVVESLAPSGSIWHD